MPTSYVTPSVLTQYPTGIAWSQLPTKDSTPAQRTAAQVQICWSATHEVDGFCNQNLRASLTTERFLAPDFYCTIQAGASGPARYHAQRFPVIRPLGGQVSPASSFPSQWTTFTGTAVQLDYSVIGDTSTDPLVNAAGAGPAAILIQPGFINWAAGRRGYKVELDYVSGWPMAGMTSQALAGATTLTVDDVTGFDLISENTNQFALATILDDDLTEDVQVTGATATNPIVTSSGLTVQSGPGTLTLRSGLLFTHNRMGPTTPTLVTSMPDSVIWATVMLASSIALTRGATASVMPAMPGSMTSTGAAAAVDMRARAFELLKPYRRPI